MNVFVGMLKQCFLAKKLPLVIFAETKHHFCVRYAVFEGDVLSLERENLDPNRLKLPLLHRHILDISELAMLTGICGKRPTQRTVLSPTNCGEI